MDFSIVEQVEDYAVFVLDSKGHILNWNRGASFLLGYECSKIIGQTIDVLLPPGNDGFDARCIILEDSKSTGKSIYEGWFIPENGIKVWVSLSVSLIKDSDCNLMCICHKIDSPNRRNSEISPLKDGLDTLFAYWDRDGVCKFASRAYKDWYGWTSDDLEGKVKLSEMLGNTYHNNVGYIEAALRGETQVVKGQALLHSGDVRDMVTYYQPDYKNSVVEGFFVQTFDVTEYNNMKQDVELQFENIKKSDEKHRKMISEIRDYAIIFLDLNGYVENWNFGAEKTTGYKAEEVVGQHFSMFYPDELVRKGRLRELLLQAAEEGSAYYEGVHLKKDGDFFQGGVLLTAIRDDSNCLTGFFTITRDLSDQKRTEELLEFSLKSLESKNKELEQFIYIASHDLQEPLRTISSYTAIIEKRSLQQMDEISKMGIKFITEASLRMKDLIKGLLDYGRLGLNAELREIYSHDIVSAVCQDLNASISEAKASIRFDHLPKIQGYETEFRLLMQNLLGNALKFRKKDVAAEISISAVSKGNVWQFSIRDNGIGIKPEFKSKIFTIFQRLNGRDDYEGTGIGLAHCKKIVDLHKGEIWVESELGEGAEFVFTISKNLN